MNERILIVMMATALCWGGVGAAGAAPNTPEGQTLVASKVAVAIARDGKALLPIVISPQSSEGTKKTAAELAGYLKRITGAEFAVETGAEPRGITLGTLQQFPDPSLAKPLEIRAHYNGREAFAIRTDRGGIRLIANTDLGVQHAAMRFLELVGCRWYFMTPTWHVVPQRSSLSFDLNEDSRPDIWSRSIWFDRLPQGGEKGDPSAKELFDRWITQNRAGKSFNVNIAHVWHRIPKEMAADFKDHPEYFALVNGKREGPQFCVTNKGLQDTIVRYAQKQLDAGGVDMVSLDPADTSGWCTCAECAKLGEHNVQPFYLANLVARVIQKSHPGKFVGLLAYSWYSMPPSFALEPNVHVQLTRGLNAGRYTSDELYDMWTARKGTLGIYEYYSYWHMDRNMIPGTWITDIDGQGARLRDYAKRGVVDISAQASDNWGIHGLAYYIAARLMWNSAADVAALRQDFMTQGFGPAAEPMSRFYARVSQASHPMPGLGLIRQAIADVEEATRLAADRPDVLARIDDIKRLLVYCYLGEMTGAPASSFVGIKMAEGTEWQQKKQAFLDWFTWAYRIRNSHMIAWLTYRSAVGNPISGQFGKEWFYRNSVKDPTLKNPWRNDEPVTSAELDRRLAAIKAEVGTLPPVTVRAAEERLVLVQLKHGDGPSTALPLTGEATWLLASLQGEPLRFGVETKPTVIKLGEGVAGVEQPRDMVVEIPDARYTVTAADGQEVGSGKLELGVSQLELKVPGPGVYRFTCRRGGAGWEARFPKDMPHALLLTPGRSSLDIVDTPGGDVAETRPVYFYVPKGTPEILLQAYQCGVVTLRDPGGKAAWEGVSDGRFVRVPVTGEQAGKAWSLTLTDHVRRGRLQFLNLPTALSFDPNRVFVPVAVAEREGLNLIAPPSKP
jgi:hypothetical protein